MKVWELLLHTAKMICEDATTTEDEKKTAEIVMNTLPREVDCPQYVLICSEGLSKSGQLCYQLGLLPENKIMTTEDIFFWDILCHRIESTISTNNSGADTTEPHDSAWLHDLIIVLSELSLYSEIDLKALNMMAQHLPKLLPWNTSKEMLLGARVYGSALYGVIYRIVTSNLGVTGLWNLRGVENSICVKKTVRAPWATICGHVGQADLWKERPHLLKFYENFERYRRIKETKADILLQKSYRSQILWLNDYTMTRDTEMPSKKTKLVKFEEIGFHDEQLP